MAMLAADNSPIHASVAQEWRDISDALSPIIGYGGVEALYRQSLAQVRTEHTWLAENIETPPGLEKLEALQKALANRTGIHAMSFNETLVRTFYDLTADLMGDSFVQQLTRSTRALPYAKPELNDASQTTHMALLCQANERLLLAALRAEKIAKVAIDNCNDLVRISQYDELTGTPKRTLLLDRLERSISLAHRQNTKVAVLFLDLDHFKQINDTLGHSVGDEVLQLTARCLDSATRDSDSICRYGGTNL